MAIQFNFQTPILQSLYNKKAEDFKRQRLAEQQRQFQVGVDDRDLQRQQWAKLIGAMQNQENNNSNPDNNDSDPSKKDLHENNINLNSDGSIDYNGVDPATITLDPLQQAYRNANWGNQKLTPESNGVPFYNSWQEKWIPKKIE